VKKISQDLVLGPKMIAWVMLMCRGRSRKDGPDFGNRAVDAYVNDPFHCFGKEFHKSIVVGDYK
jgi:hypothetical protein